MENQVLKPRFSVNRELARTPPSTLFSSSSTLSKAGVSENPSPLGWEPFLEMEMRERLPKELPKIPITDGQMTTD